MLTNTNGKYSRQIAMANSCGKFLLQIVVANSHGKFSNMQSRKWCEISSVWESFAREDKKKANNKVKVFLLKLKKPLGHGWLKLKD